MSLHLRTFAIVNPTAAAGKVTEAWPLIERLLRAKLPELDFVFTEGPGHATLLAREALRAGWEMIVSIGGDGTLNEVVNGFFEKPDPITSYELDAEGWIVPKDIELRPIHSNAVLGHIPLGTGGDFRRTVGLMGDFSETINHLGGRHTRPIDIGQIGYLDNKGNLASRYFINIASAGLSGKVDYYSDRTWKGLGGNACFLTASVRAIATWKNVDVQVRLDQTDEFSDKMMNLIIANGEFFGSGMWVAPGAELDDGAFQVVFLNDLSKREAAEFIIKVYQGKHLNMRKIQRRRARQISVRATNPGTPTMLLDVDGEQPGTIPATWSVQPAAINFKL